MVNSAGQQPSRRELSDLLLQPPLEQIDMLNWHAFDRAIDAGYRHAKEKVAEWQRKQEQEALAGVVAKKEPIGQTSQSGNFDGIYGINGISTVAAGGTFCLVTLWRE